MKNTRRLEAYNKVGVAWYTTGPSQNDEKVLDDDRPDTPMLELFEGEGVRNIYFNHHQKQRGDGAR